MSTNPLIPPFPTNSNNSNNHLFAAIDLGSNSFKLRIIKTNPNSNHRFITLHRLKEPVVLVSGGPIISTSATSRALTSLHNFKQIITSLHIPNQNLRLVATSAVRESSNQLEFVELVRQELGFDIEVLSGFDEARLTYLGVLQFYPVFDRTVLTVDIGGGSTEFVVGFRGVVKLGVSLKLGHVTLTQKFVGNKAGGAMREYIRNVVKESGLVDKVKGENIDLVIGSSGSIRMIEKANFMRWNGGLVNEIGLFEGFRREWKFSKEELRELVEKMCDDEIDEKVFKKRSAFILAAVVLLDEIFELFGIDEMEVSGFSLGEGVIAEKLTEVYDGFDLSANARWRSVLRLASRFCNKERMTSAASCASIAQGIFTGLRKLGEIGEPNEVLLDEKDLEYLEAACLLHNIGLINGKKGYHKRSYHIIMNGEHLHGYNAEEVKIIALLARHHRKKMLKPNHDSLSEYTDEMKHKLRVLCTIIRLSAVLKEVQSLSVPHVELSHYQDCFKLVLRDDSSSPAKEVQSIPEAIIVELRKELNHFEEVFQQKLSVVGLSSHKDDPDQFGHLLSYLSDVGVQLVKSAVGLSICKFIDTWHPDLPIWICITTYIVIVIWYIFLLSPH